MKALLEERYSQNPDKDHISSSSDDLVLIPGLPNHLAHLCLSRIHPSLLYSVSHSWRHLIYSPNFPPFFSLYAILSLLESSTNRSIGFLCFDPISSKWDSLPCPPSNPPLQFLHRHPSFIARILPIQSLTVSGRLLLIAATTSKFLPALDRPLGFDPLTKNWFFGPPMLTPRRWCVTGAVDGAVCVVSGMGSHYRVDVASSLEKWDMKRRGIEWNWEKMAELKDAIGFSREAIEAVGYKGKLYMVNVKGNAAKQGTIYDIGMNQWEKMSNGMLAGWNGPAAMDEDRELIYSVDEAKGTLSRYDPDNDCWEELIKSPEYLKGAEQIAAGRGRGAGWRR